MRSAETCRAINTISGVYFRRLRISIYGMLSVLGICFLILCTVVVVIGALQGAFIGDAAVLLYCNLLVFLTPAILFFVSAVVITILLNVSFISKIVNVFMKLFQIIGFKLVKSLRASKEIIKNTINTAMSVNTYKKTVNLEKINTYKCKKVALRKALAIQIGLSACLFIESIGFLFMSGAVGLVYMLDIFYIFYDIGITVFIILILCIYNPMKQVQQLFRADSDQKIQASPNSSSSMTNSKKSTKALTISSDEITVSESSVWSMAEETEVYFTPSEVVTSV